MPTFGCRIVLVAPVRPGLIPTARLVLHRRVMLLARWLQRHCLLPLTTAYLLTKHWFRPGSPKTPHIINTLLPRSLIYFQGLIDDTMRFVSRLHVCAALAIFTILYITWMNSAGFEETVHTVWRGSAHRIVVFGNDWSDTGSYRVSSSASSAIVARDVDRGDLWVETLCKKVSATCSEEVVA